MLPLPRLMPDMPSVATSIGSPRHSCPIEEYRLLEALMIDHETASQRSDTPMSSTSSDALSTSTVASTAGDAGDSQHKDGIEDVFSPVRDTPSPMSAMEDGSEGHAEPVLSSTSSDSDDADGWSTYPLVFSPYPKTRFLPNSTSSLLRPGSRFQGTQESDRQVYEVRVDLKHVDMKESFLCGHLRIQGLTQDHPTLETYFEGEIIGDKYTFQTRHPEWGSTEKVDRQHWGRFKEWEPLAKAAKSPNFTYKNYASREHIFMRWKEHFLVPDHRVRTITGASFEGFYYICFNQFTGKITGIYFHSRSEKYQQLELGHVEDGGCMPAFEFT